MNRGRTHATIRVACSETSVPPRWLRAKSIPLEIQEHTPFALSKMIKVGKRTSPMPSVPFFINTSTAPSSRTSPAHSITSSQAIQSPEIKSRFCLMEQKIDSFTARMDSIKDLCHQLKSNTDIILQNIQQLASNFYSTHQSPPSCCSPAAKSQRLLAD